MSESLEYSMAAADDLPEMVLCIPGLWKDRAALVRDIAKSTGGYLFAGGVLMNMDTKFSCELNLESADPRMLNAFRAAGPHWRETAEMRAIGTHESVIYLIGKGGSEENAKAMMFAAAALVKIGGLGVKVESSGLAHSGDKWLDLAESLHLFSAHEALVVYVTGPETYSCGMHNLGLRDAIVEMEDEASATELLRVFTHYIYSESPTIKDGETFSADASAPVYRVNSDEGVEYGKDSLFNNPYGTWRLIPAGPNKAMQATRETRASEG
jgi:hypothetical protein